jgi:deoxycitidine kinase
MFLSDMSQDQMSAHFSLGTNSNESSTEKPKQIFLTIEGNIGGGKTTMINRLRQECPDYVIIDEPVEQWLQMKDEQGTSLLELFYQDQKRWGYTFQTSAFITRYLSAFTALKQPITKDTIYISERGILTDRYVFAEMLHAQGSLNQVEWDLYTKWFDHFKHSIHIDGIVYVTTAFDVCKERIKIRGRQGEDNIPMTYLDELEQQHEKWLSSTELPVLKISSDADQVQSIKDFVGQLLATGK